MLEFQKKNFFFEFKTKKKNPMSLTIVLGSMYSGKSEELMRRVRRFKAIDWTVCVINSAHDSRCDAGMVQSHSGQTHTAMKSHTLADINVSDYAVVAVDEAQFFEDVVQATRQWLAEQNMLYWRA